MSDFDTIASRQRAVLAERLNSDTQEPTTRELSIAGSSAVIGSEEWWKSMEISSLRFYEEQLTNNTKFAKNIADSVLEIRNIKSKKDSMPIAIIDAKVLSHALQGLKSLFHAGGQNVEDAEVEIITGADE